MKIKWDIEKAKKEFEIKGLKLLEKEFKNVDYPMKCVAKCGHEKTLSLSNLKINHGLLCKECSHKKRAKERAFKYEDVKKYFEKEGCILLSKEYTRDSCKLKYVARCGHENKISFNKFRISEQGRVCAKCRHLSGKNHPNYNPNLTDEERINNRDYYAIEKWRISVYEKDNYTCQCCGDSKGGNLNAHHLNGFNWDIENRSNTKNGITLCERCHKDFHKKYGYGNNTIEQFREWYKCNTQLKKEKKHIH